MAARSIHIAGPLLLLMFFLNGCFAPKPYLPPERIRPVSISIDGTVRQTLLYAPAERERAEPRLYPLLLAFHNQNGDAHSLSRLSRNRLQELAEARGFFLAFPIAERGSWFDGHSIHEEEARKQGLPVQDDVQFVRRLLDELLRRYPIDPLRVHALGFENGGFLTMKLACQMPERWRSLAILSAGMIPEERCILHRPVSMLLVHGSADPFVPYGGGEVRLLNERRGMVLPFYQTSQFLRSALQCPSEPDSRIRSDFYPDDHTSLNLERYDHCAGERRLHLLTIEGGGHNWPGGWSPLPESVAGARTEEWKAAEQIIEFFFSGNETRL